MTSLWQPISRGSCLNTRTILQSCHNIDSLAARLARNHFKSFSSNTHRSRPDRWRRGEGTGDGKWRTPCQIVTRIGSRAFASNRIITHYNDLPKDFTPEEGLNFSVKPLSVEEVEAIFSQPLDPVTINQLMNTIHGQRVAGTLEDPNSDVLTKYEMRIVMAALAWLRKNVPVDEIGNAGLRAEEELAAMEVDILKDSERIGIYKPNSGGNWSGKKDKSVLVEVKRARDKEAKRKEKAEAAARNKQAQEIQQNTGTLEPINPRARVLSTRNLRPASENEWYKEYAAKANLLEDDKIPDMTTFQRLWPSALTVLAVFTACYIFTQFYIPPKSSARIWPEIPPSAATVGAIIAINAAILFLWRIPPLFRFFNTYFLCVPAAPVPFSIIGNIFSHQSVTHFALNMATCWFIGTRVHDEIGRANFLALYFSSGVLASFTSLAWFVARGSFISSSLGASGAISGLIGTYLMLQSESKITVFGFPPEGWPSISSMGLLIVLVAAEILGVLRLGRGQSALIDHAAHLGGYAGGIGYCELLKMRSRQRVEAEIQRRKNLGVGERVMEAARRK